MTTCYLSCTTRYSKLSRHESFHAIRITTLLGLLTLAAASLLIAFVNWIAAMAACLSVMGAFFIATYVFNRLQFSSLVISEKYIQFPAGIFSSWHRTTIPWKSVKEIRIAARRADGQISAVAIDTTHGKSIIVDDTVLDFSNSILWAIPLQEKSKLSAELNECADRQSRESMNRGLDRLAMRSAEDALVVETIRRMAAEGASASEIMEAQFNIRYGEDFSPPTDQEGANQ